MLFGINSTNNAIKITRGKRSAISIALRALLIPNSKGYPCYHSLIVGQLVLNHECSVATLYSALTVCFFLRYFPTAPLRINSIACAINIKWHAYPEVICRVWLKYLLVVILKGGSTKPFEPSLAMGMKSSTVLPGIAD